MTNPYCQAMGIDVPHLVDLVEHREAGTFVLLLVALLEEGGPLTLEDAAARISEAGGGTPGSVLRSLKRCRPDRPPVYRHGDLCHLDPFDYELSMWAFRLGLRPPRYTRLHADGSPLTDEEHQRQIDERSERNGLRFAALKRVLIRAFPGDAPEALVLLDVDEGRVERFAGEALSGALTRLDEYDAIAGEYVRPTLLGLGMDVRALRLHELRPPQKTIKASERGSVLDITTERLLRSSCGISRRWGREAPLRKLLDAGKFDRLLDHLEAEAHDLAALYHYGRLHGALRLRYRQMDEMLRVPWVYLFSEWRIGNWMRPAHEAGQPVEVVAGDAPDPKHPWADAVWCTVYQPEGYLPALVTAQRQLIQIDDVQRLRMARPGDWHAPLPAEAAGPSTAVGVAPSAFGADERILRIRISLDLEPETEWGPELEPEPVAEPEHEPEHWVEHKQPHEQQHAPEHEHQPEYEPVWRVIEVPASFSFWDLHVAIQDAMGWQDYHLHAFNVFDPNRGEMIEIGIPTDDYYPGEPLLLAGWQVPTLRYLNAAQPECTYEYDFGDSWVHHVRLEAIEPNVPGRHYPRCVAGGRSCPPEDVGGTGGYELLLEALADPTHEEHESYLSWVGDSFDPAAFDVSAVKFDDAGKRWEQGFAVR